MATAEELFISHFARAVSSHCGSRPLTLCTRNSFYFIMLLPSPNEYVNGIVSFPIFVRILARMRRQCLCWSQLNVRLECFYGLFVECLWRRDYSFIPARIALTHLKMGTWIGAERVNNIPICRKPLPLCLDSWSVRWYDHIEPAITARKVNKKTMNYSDSICLFRSIIIGSSCKFSLKSLDTNGPGNDNTHIHIGQLIRKYFIYTKN